MDNFAELAALENLAKREDLMKAEDWKAMYKILVNGICNAVKQIGDKESYLMVTDTLVSALLEAEDYYIKVPEAPGETRRL